MFGFANPLGKLHLSQGAVFITRQAQERFMAQGARCKEKQSMPYCVQPCTVYLGPCTSAGLPGIPHEATYVTLK